jgi:hypothetical protein
MVRQKQIVRNKMLVADKILSYYNGKYLSSLISPGSEKLTYITEVIMSVTPRPEAVISDRTGTFKGRYKTQTTPIPEPISSFTKTFDQICQERATELLSTNKTLLVAWSGGIDSTAILVSLLKNANSKDQIKVVLESRSIIENENFYNNHIKDNLQHEITENYWISAFKPNQDELLISGNKIPQIFGFTGACFMENRNDPWEPYVRNKLDNVNYNFFMKKAPELFEKSPFPIVSIFDMLWWICFTLRWTNSETRVFRFDNDYSSECFNNNVSFFGSDDFQYWSMFNHDKKIKDTPESFKYVLKDLIYSYDKNVDYRDNMISMPSAGPTNSNDSTINSRTIIYDKVINNELPLLVDTNFNSFTKEYVENNKNDFKKLLNVSDISEFIFKK